MNLKECLDIVRQHHEGLVCLSFSYGNAFAFLLTPYKRFVPSCPETFFALVNKDDGRIEYKSILELKIPDKQRLTFIDVTKEQINRL